MKVYDIVALNERLNLSERNPSAAQAAELGRNLIADKQILPDGRIRVLLPDGEILDFADQAQLNRATADAKDRIGRKVGGFRSLRRMALSRMVWWPATAIQIGEAVYSVCTEFTSETGDPQAALGELIEAAGTAIIAIMLESARVAAAGANGLKWIKRLTTAKRSAQIATAALGAAGFATGGVSWIGALITGAGWIATEVALYFATEYFVDMIVDEFFDTEELSQEVSTELADEISLMLGLTRDARHVDDDGDGQPDNIDRDTGRVLDPETGEPFKYNIGDLTQDDVNRLLNPNLTPAQRQQLATNPNYRDFYQRWNQQQTNANRGNITSFERESVRESEEEKVAGTEELRGFIKFLDEKGYDKDLQNSVARVGVRAIRQNRSN